MEDAKSIFLGKCLSTYAKVNNYTIPHLEAKIYEVLKVKLNQQTLKFWIKNKNIPNIKDNHKLIEKFFGKVLAETYIYQYEEWPITNKLLSLLLGATKEFIYGGLMELNSSDDQLRLFLEYCHERGIIGSFKVPTAEGIKRKLVNDQRRIKLLVGRSVLSKTIKILGGLNSNVVKELNDFVLIKDTYGKEFNVKKSIEEMKGEYQW